MSFYSSKRRFYSNFVPRIKMPNILQSQQQGNLPKRASLRELSILTSREKNGEIELDYSPCSQIPALIDFDEYDNQIFKTSSKSDAKKLVATFVFWFLNVFSFFQIYKRHRSGFAKQKNEST